MLNHRQIFFFMKTIPSAVLILLLGGSPVWAQFAGGWKVGPLGGSTRNVSTINGKTVQKPIIKTSAGDYVEGTKGRIKIEDKDNVLNSHPDLPLTFDVQSTSPGRYEVTDVKLPAVSQWQADLDTKIDPSKQPLVSSVTEAVEALDVESKQALRTGNLSNFDSVTDKFEALKENILRTYATVPPSEHTVRTTLAKSYLTSQSGEKAWYGRDDNYRPEVYEMIYQQSRCCVGITKHKQMKPLGSGVLIGPNTVLTADHVIEDGIGPDDFDVIFNYEQRRDENNEKLVDAPTAADSKNKERLFVRKRVKAFYFVGTAPDPDSSPLDFALLQIDNPEPQEEKRTFVKISADRVTPDTPIFLIGHPRQAPRLVHDNSWIKFPYQVSESERMHLLVGVNGELGFSGSSDAAEEADKFMAFYKPQTDAAGRKSYVYINRRSGKALHYMGAECDTFHGDSGAPAMLRESGELVGILVGGEPDQEDMPNEGRAKSNSYLAGWIHHEKLLPIVKVIEQLDKEKNGWRQECGAIISK
jgi:V8-like Glu-specific endopeptidase